MSKIIIDNKIDWLSDTGVMYYIKDIIGRGLISEGKNGSQYCLKTGYRIDRGNVWIYAEKYSTGTHKFTVKDK